MTEIVFFTRGKWKQGLNAKSQFPNFRGIQNVAVILAVCREVIDEVVEALPGQVRSSSDNPTNELSKALFA